MAMIYKTTMRPGKTELLAAWLPTRPWYASTGHAPELDRSGGFRLDDPEGEVGIEFMVLTDTSGGRETCYLVPLTYRGAPLEGAEAGLVGISEHGVLGTRWIYDGSHDPVFVGQLLALLQGRAVAQDQCDSGVADPSVTARFDGPELPEVLPGTRLEITDGERRSYVSVPRGPLLALRRVLRSGDDGWADATGVTGRLTAGWTAPDGSSHRALIVALRTSGHAEA
ncbi:maltokinase N-terminal cap-like domain-containing protein [Streptomyces sp. NPDC003952]